jgi:CubicO group peptidase (beta-lactamase class C family)
MKFLKPSAEFRDVYQYDNSMYSLLSYLPTLVLPSKIPFTRYVKQHIFDPLDMTSTTYSYDIANASGQLAEGMTKQGNFSGNIFANGTVRALPFLARGGGEDGSGEYYEYSKLSILIQSFNLALSGAGGVITTATDIVRADHGGAMRLLY